MIAGAGGAAQRVGLDFFLFAQADEERALIFVAKQDEAARRAVEFRRRHARGQRAPLTKKRTRSGEPMADGADVDFERWA